MPPTRREKQKDTPKKLYWRKMNGFDAFNVSSLHRGLAMNTSGCQVKCVTLNVSRFRRSQI